MYVCAALPGQEKVWRLLDNAKVGHIMSKTGMPSCPPSSMHDSILLFSWKEAVKAHLVLFIWLLVCLGDRLRAHRQQNIGETSVIPLASESFTLSPCPHTPPCARCSNPIPQGNPLLLPPPCSPPTCPLDCIDIAGLGQKIVDNFGEAKLLDDIIDHWDAGRSCRFHLHYALLNTQINQSCS